MFSKITGVLILLLLPILGSTQNCSFTLSGYVEDSGIGVPLEAVSVYVNETKRGTITDSLGFFQIKNFCSGEYHLIISHIGCESKQSFIHLTKDTTLQIEMEHSINELESVVVKDKSRPISTQNSQVITGQNIVDNASQNLSNMLESISGVSTLKNGNGIAKPVVHGLYGNRLTILNNGVSQSGQQWGNDHSPEIDPLVANRISVIKGVNALEYAGSNLGSVVLVEPKKIDREPHLHGKASYFFESNGLGNGLNLQMQQFRKPIGWKINGTLKKSGDKKTADYFLRNTGSQEANFALQLERSFSDKLFTDFYASTFNTELAVLRGAHIGNLTDLETAFTRTVPFFTEDKFSYALDAPKQKVNHHLLKLHAKYFLNSEQFLDFAFAGQVNIRKEFDVRRSGRSDIPALSLEQFSYFLETKYQRNFSNQLILNTGIQVNIIDNTNNPETGILPLIPDYFAYESGVFARLSKTVNKSLIEVGIRYDNIYQNVVSISNTTPRKTLRFNNIFHNLNGLAGWTYHFNQQLNLSYNIGYATRNPATNELYSSGLHQGVSGIEEGNVDLQSEHAIKSTLSFNGKIRKRFSFESLIYYQHIQDYIFLNPQDETRLTIRGAFPVFKYEQTNASIYGLDFSAQWELSKTVHSKFTYSFIKGDDLSLSVPLINMPANNFTGSINYQFPTAIKIGNLPLENFELELESKYVFGQGHLLTEQDFVVAPTGYNLLKFKFATDIQWKKFRIRLSGKVDNLLNTAYRDYLNRQRYFADDLGINILFGINIKF